MIAWLKRYFLEPAAYHCKPLLWEHEWRAPENKWEKYPVCVHCGASCWWMYGYTMNSGTHLRMDLEAISVMRSEAK